MATPRRQLPKLILNKSEDKKSAEILIYDDIGPAWAGMIGAETVAQALKDAGDVESITVRINSPGGFVWEGTAIYNLLKNHKAQVRVEIDALAASIASVIAQAGDKIVIAKNAMMMIHNPLAMTIGGSEEHRKRAELLDQLRDTILDTYADRAGEKSTREALAKMMDDETWLKAEAAVEAGLADEIAENKQAAPTAHVDPQIYGYKNTPDQFLIPADGKKKDGEKARQGEEGKERNGSSPTPSVTPSPRLNLAQRRQQLAEAR